MAHGLCGLKVLRAKVYLGYLALSSMSQSILNNVSVHLTGAQPDFAIV